MTYRVSSAKGIETCPGRFVKYVEVIRVHAAENIVRCSKWELLALNKVTRG